MASLVVRNEKEILVWGCRFFVSDVISGGLSVHLGPHHLNLGTNRWMVVFRLFLLETRVKSECFDTLDDLQGFCVRKLWSKVNKIFGPFRVNSQEVVMSPSPIYLKLSLSHMMKSVKKWHDYNLKSFLVGGV